MQALESINPIPAHDVTAEHRAVFSPHHAVDHKVDGGVQYKEDMREEPQGNAPDREAPKVSVLAPVDILDDCNLMHVED